MPHSNQDCEDGASARRGEPRRPGGMRPAGGGLPVHMTTVGLIGSGMIGSTVARLAIAAGYDAALSNSRGPETLRDVVESLGPRARAATGDEAAVLGDLVVVAVPVKAYPVLPEALAGRLVLDTGNYYPQRDGNVPGLDDKSLTSSEYLRRNAPGAEVVKVFNNIFFKHLQNLARPAGSANRSCLPIAGDSAAAKERAAEFLDAIGYEALDYGPLAESWRQEPGTPAYGAPYGSLDDEKGTSAGVDVIRAAIDAATR
jgi:8-hydroxy-5-deazaflavin:NADPH oxidoreductase